MSKVTKKVVKATNLVDKILGESFPAPTRNKVADIPLEDPRATLATIKKALTELTNQVESLSSVFENMEFKKSK